MLSNHQNVVCSNSTVVIAPLASVDICDIDTSGADDDDDNNDSTTTTTTTITNSNGLPSILVNNNNYSSDHNRQNQYAPTMHGNRPVRPSTINLKPITCENGVKVSSDKDITDGCFHSATDDSENYSSSGQGINIQFQDIIYRARHEISWDRCKYRSFHSIIIMRIVLLKVKQNVDKAIDV